jgi:hypothetical protein
LIRAGNLSRVDRIVAGVIGTIVLAVSALAAVLAIFRSVFPLLVAAVGGVCIGVLFIATARSGRPLAWRRRSETSSR